MPDDGWTEGDVDNPDGGQLHWYRKGRGPVLVLAHGMSDNAMCWRRVADALTSHFDVVAYDAPSHGKSSDGRYGVGVDFIAIVEGLELGPVLGIGHSMGAATVAAALAARPELFRAAVLEDPGWMTPARMAEVMKMAQEARANATALSREEYAPADPIDAADWRESKTQYRPNEAMTGAVFRAPWQDTVRGFSRPVLLAWGTSGLVTGDTVAEARSLFPDLRDVQFDAGHNIRREAYEPFVAAVRTFLQDASPAPA
jgi:N-formylmaleamate deformylase